jgi:hypothetical protein
MIFRVMPPIVGRMSLCTITAAALILNAAPANAISIGPQADEVLSPDLGTVELNAAIGVDRSSLLLDYDPGARLDVVGLAVAPFLPTGALAAGAGYDTLDLPANSNVEGSEPWATQVSAIVSAIPEPGTFVLLGIGIALAIGRRILISTE